MERALWKSLQKWKSSPARKPLILRGARQVGKTWLLKEFGRAEYASCVYVNCDKDAFAAELFRDYDVKRILLALEAFSGTPVRPGETLVIFDELQEAPRGIGALKYFCEDAPGVHVAAAGSLLGIALHPGASYPVGKVDALTLRPFSFAEFLAGTGDAALARLLASGDWAAIDTLRETLIERLRRYFFVGGMPEAVAAFAAGRPLAEVRRIQDAIVAAYQEDVSKHAPAREVPRINLVWRSLVAQLAKENRKFVYGALKHGGRAKEFELAIQWLADAGVVHRVNRVSKPALPLKFYEDFSAFKLFPLDCGLMGAMAATPAAAVLAGDAGFAEYKGAFAEAYVLAEMLAAQDAPVFYFSASDSMVEIDFIAQKGEAVVPVEVKAAENLHSKSLPTFVAAHEGLKGVRFSLSPYPDQGWMENVPLYG
ncbi:MAG: ATP-binding protein, partial [Planctomycetes bacterium]|nr:ATP-binding protein [Planctomycetota bacterium]